MDNRYLGWNNRDNHFIVIAKPEDESTISKAIYGLGEWDFKFHYGKIPYTANLYDRLVTFVQEFGFQYNKNAELLINSLSNIYTPKDRDFDNIGKLPFLHEKLGADFGLHYKKILIGDEPGLGKTIQTILMWSEVGGKILIVCPSVMKLTWKQEFLGWIPGLSEDNIHIIYGRTIYQLPEALIYITNYDILPWWRGALLNFPFVVMDEFHYIANNSKRTRAVLAATKNAEYVVGLSGTPIVNHHIGLLRPLKAIGRLCELGGEHYYKHYYCKSHYDNYGRVVYSAEHTKELHDELIRSGIYIRRRKIDVLKDLPSKQRSIIPVALNNWKEYHKAETQFYDWASQLNGSINTPKELDEDDFTIESYKDGPIAFQGMARINSLKQLATIGKMAAIKEWIDNFLETGEKLLLFAFFKKSQQAYKDMFPATHTLSIMAADSLNERQETMHRFNTDPTINLCVASLKAGGVGITMTGASTVAVVELGWTGAEHIQAEDRVHRIGQEYPVNVYYFLAHSSIEMNIFHKLIQKEEIVNNVVDGGEPETVTFKDMLIELMNNK